MCIRDRGDKYLLSKEEIENKIATFTGGRAAEEVVFGEITKMCIRDRIWRSTRKPPIYLRGRNSF